MAVKTPERAKSVLKALLAEKKGHSKFPLRSRYTTRTLSAIGVVVAKDQKRDGLLDDYFI
jgi:hypothetical protein